MLSADAQRSGFPQQGGVLFAVIRGDGGLRGGRPGCRLWNPLGGWDIAAFQGGERVPYKLQTTPVSTAAPFGKTGNPQALSGGKAAAGEQPIFARGRAPQKILNPGWQAVPQERVLRSQEEGKRFRRDDEIGGAWPAGKRGHWRGQQVNGPASRAGEEADFGGKRFRKTR